MKIVIIGAGISGLSTYLFLKKHLLDPHPGQHSVKIYEGYNILDLPAATWELGSKSAAGGEIVPSTAPLNAGIAIRLMAAWEVLRDEVMRIDPDALVIRKVEEVTITGQQDMPTKIRFADGTYDEADLLIGADGLRSIVRRAMFENTEDLEAQSWFQWAIGQARTKKDYVTPQFQNMIGLGGLVTSSILKDRGLESETDCIAIGPYGAFGYGYLTSAELPTEHEAGSKVMLEAGPIAAWWSTFPATIAAGDAKMAQEGALKYLLSQRRPWYDPAIQSILDSVENTGINHLYPVYMTPELTDWHIAGKVTLVGDAAHTLNSTFRQGACQALEDSETLARVLAHYIGDGMDGFEDRQAVAVALEKYTAIRKPRLHVLYEHSRRMAIPAGPHLGLLGEIIALLTLWIVLRLKSTESFNKYLLKYDLPKEVDEALLER